MGSARILRLKLHLKLYQKNCMISSTKIFYTILFEI